MYPKFLGKPLYPGGLPVPPENCNYGEHNAKALYYLHNEDKLNDDQKEMLKEYIIYYLKAPCWENADLLDKPLDKMSIDDIIDEMWNIGIDPF